MWTNWWGCLPRTNIRSWYLIQHHSRLSQAWLNHQQLRIPHRCRQDGPESRDHRRRTRGSRRSSFPQVRRPLPLSAHPRISSDFNRSASSSPSSPSKSILTPQPTDRSRPPTNTKLHPPSSAMGPQPRPRAPRHQARSLHHPPLQRGPPWPTRRLRGRDAGQVQVQLLGHAPRGPAAGAV